ncbi:MAG TPA: hypothetical protein VFT45_12075 [Longimicrobium sp.]|nr:hypothetical protein [Longimicrobium sp.]
MIGARGARLAVLGLFSVASVACSQGLRDTHAVDPCTGPGADATGWKVADAGRFRFSVPGEYQHQTVQGVDSYVGWWSAPGGRNVRFDWGMYSSSLDEPATVLRDRVECTTEIGGHRVKLVGGFDAEGRWEADGRKYVVAAAWRDVHPGVHLTLSATAADAADVPVLLSIIRSVRFQPGDEET